MVPRTECYISRGANLDTLVDKGYLNEVPVDSNDDTAIYSVFTIINNSDNNLDVY